jgi:hypothetical protein
MSGNFDNEKVDQDGIFIYKNTLYFILFYFILFYFILFYFIFRRL